MSKMSFKTLLLLVLIISACVKDKFDFGKLNEIELTPELWIPFGEVRLSLQDLQRDTTLITVDQDGFISIVIEKDSMLRTSLDKALLIPEQDTNYLAVVTGQSLQTDISINVFNEAEYKKIYFDTLEISWMLPSGTPPGTVINLAFGNSQHQGGSLVIEMNNTTHQEGEFNTSTFYNGFIDLSKNNTSLNTLQLSGNVVQTASWVPNGTPISFVFNLKKMTLKGVEGYIGNSTIDLPVFNNQISLRGLEKFTQGIQFKNPTLKLTVFNQSGLEIAFNPNINGANAQKGDVVRLETPTIAISKSTSPGQATSTIVTLDKNNSNLAELLNKLPDNITASGILILNPSGKQNNFLFNHNQLIVNGIIEIPMEFSAKNMFFENEIKNFKFWESENQTPEFVEFELNSQNYFPFDLNVMLVFDDSLTNDVIRVFDLDILKAAPTNANGKVTNPISYQSRLTLSGNDLKNLNMANRFRLQVRINTPNSGNEFVKLYDSYQFRTRISGRAKLKIQPVR